MIFSQVENSANNYTDSLQVAVNSRLSQEETDISEIIKLYHTVPMLPPESSTVPEIFDVETKDPIFVSIG